MSLTQQQKQAPFLSNFVFSKIVLLVSLLFPNIGFSQSDNLKDSLYHLVNIAESDSVKTKQYEAYILYLSNTADNAIIPVCEEMIEWGRSNNIPCAVAKAKSNIGLQYYYDGKYEQSIEILRESEKIYKAENELVGLIQSLYWVSFSYEKLGKRKELEAILQDGLSWAKKLNAPRELGLMSSRLTLFYFNGGDMTKARVLADEAIELLKDTEQRNLYGSALRNKAIVIENTNRPKAIKLLKEALEIDKKGGDLAAINNTAQILLEQYQTMGDIESAIHLARTLLEDAKKAKDKNAISNAYKSLGNLHRSFEDYDTALKNYEEGLKIAENIEHSLNIIILSASIGKTKELTENYQESVEYFKKALAKCNRGYLTLHITCDLASTYLKMDSLNQAYNTLLKADSLGEFGTPYVEVVKDLAWAAYYLKINKTQQAIDLALAAQQFAVEAQDNAINMQAKKILYQAYQKEQNYEQAFAHFYKYSTAKDSINQKNYMKQITTIDLNNQFNQEKEIVAFEQAKQETILKAETQQYKTVATGIGLLALLGFGFFWNARQQNKKITTQNTQISQQNTQLEQLNTTKDRIFAIIGHDLRKPVIAFNGISETINYLIQKEDYSTLKQLGTEIEQDGFAMQKLTDNLLNWALMQRDVMPHRPQLVALSPKVEEVLAIFEKVAMDKDIELKHSVPADMEVYADANALMTILVNLTDNAVKYTPQGGQVTIEAVATDKGVKIQISDNGVGMPAEKLKDIFVLQKDKSEKGTKGESGTGLGLHLVNELVKMNNGNIVAKSEIGKGTRFEVQLPKQEIAA